MAQTISEEKAFNKPTLRTRTDPFNEELKALQFKSLRGVHTTALGENHRDYINNNRTEEEEQEKRNEGDEEGRKQLILIEDNAIVTKTVNERTGEDLEVVNSMHMQAAVTDRSVDWAIEEAVPLNQQNLESEEDLEFEASIWVHQNIIKLSKEFGLAFNGCEREA